jgi:SAM-dependent methyltransferase
MPPQEPPTGPSWSARAALPGLASVLDPADLLGAKNELIDRTHKSALASILGDVRGTRILDFGCGTGRLTHWLSNRGAQARGVDAAPEMVAAARRLFSNIEVEVAGIPLPFESETFDTVLTVFVLQYPVTNAAELSATVLELARVLHRRGRLIAIEQVHGEGGLAWGAPAEAYASAMRNAGLRVTTQWPIRLGSSRFIRLVERRPRVALLPMLPRLIQREARRAGALTATMDYVDTLFAAERPCDDGR